MPTTEAPPPSAKKSGYLPGLDGWRAIAILSVMFAHDTPMRWQHLSLVEWQPFGGMGVGLFFAISGFLITTRILEEEKATGHFRLKAFYIRRLFRIQPAQFVYLAVIALLVLTGVLNEAWRYFVGALFLFRNFQDNNFVPFLGGFTGHFWTLSVEEHFYLLLSLFLFFVRKHRDLGLLLLIVATFALQSFMLHHQHVLAQSGRFTWVMLPFLLIPSLLAVLLQRPPIHSRAVRWLHPLMAHAITVVLLLLDAFHRTHGHIPHTVHGFISEEGIALSYCFPLWIIASTLHARSITTRTLEWYPLRWIGRLSYSLYLWHVLFFRTESTHLPHIVNTRPWNYVLSFAAALLSFYFVEKPLIRLGHRLAPPVTPGHRDLDPSIAPNAA